MDKLKSNIEYLFIDTGVKKMKWFLSSHKVPFPATSDRRSRVAGNGTEWEVKTIELSSSTSGGEQWAFLNFLILTAVKKTVPKLRNTVDAPISALPNSAQAPISAPFLGYQLFLCSKSPE